MHSLAVLLAVMVFLTGPQSEPLGRDGGRVAAVPIIVQEEGAPALINPGLECSGGYDAQPGVRGVAPRGWTALVLDGSSPYFTSTHLWANNGRCDPVDYWWVEKIEGHDSFMFMGGYAPLGQDFPAPPFDAALYQRVAVTPGQTYSLSAWMVSLCGGSAMPSDCPAGYYIAKRVGLDPTGSADPQAAVVNWVEDRRPHYESRWANFSLAATALNSYMTVFLGVTSPFAHHGNHAFADAVKLVRAPTALLTATRLNGRAIAVSWTGDIGPDIRAITAGNYQLHLDVQYRAGGGDWQNWVLGQSAGTATLTAPPACASVTYRFRVRSWAQQPVGQPGAWPPHTFGGAWQEAQPVLIAGAYDCPHRTFLPGVAR